VKKNIAKVWSILGGEQIDVDRIDVQIEKRKLRSRLDMDPQATLKSYLTLPLAIEGEIIGCISLNSEQSNAFDAQDLQFFSVIGYQMAATLKHFQRLSSIKNIALFDTLTGLYNRRYFEERLGLEAQKSFFGGTALSLVMIDIDHFKTINDAYGHRAGDVILRETAQLIMKSIREVDTAARWGGEEFSVLIPNTSKENAGIPAMRILKSVADNVFPEIRDRRITVSIGIADVLDPLIDTEDKLVNAADLAMYEAKRKGRNRIEVSPDSTDKAPGKKKTSGHTG
jgi:diguanylate cyclase (GGDEF)-like protein